MTEIPGTYPATGIVKLTSPYDPDTVTRTSVTILGDTVLMRIDAPALNVNVHMNRAGLTALWEAMADLDASVPDPNYDSTRDV